MTADLDLNSIADESEETEMATFEHGVICGNIIGELRAYLKGKNLGRVVDSSPEYRFLENIAKNRKFYRQPDISFLKQERLPLHFRSYPEFAPDLAVEVISPGDKDYDIETKIMEYQKAGVSLVWIIHPVSRRVEVYRLKSGLRAQIYMDNDEVDGEELIAGFKLSVATIFDYPPEANPEPPLN